MLDGGLLTIKEATRLLKVSERKLWDLTNKHGLPCIRLGSRTVRYDPQDVTQWLERQKAGVTAGSCGPEAG
jgi:excisionase family DNA binding protein